MCETMSSILNTAIPAQVAKNVDIQIQSKPCAVCLEPSAGFHFGAFTCEGCKSFFGRTYNNVGALGECKNNGLCVINKKNRTSCKSCRLKKCINVGMSKSGSRYGRRSNWFKIHCLIQDQVEMTGNQHLLSMGNDNQMTNNTGSAAGSPSPSGQNSNNSSQNNGAINSSNNGSDFVTQYKNSLKETELNSSSNSSKLLNNSNKCSTNQSSYNSLLQEVAKNSFKKLNGSSNSNGNYQQRDDVGTPPLQTKLHKFNKNLSQLPLSPLSPVSPLFQNSFTRNLVQAAVNSNSNANNLANNINNIATSSAAALFANNQTNVLANLYQNPLYQNYAAALHPLQPLLQNNNNSLASANNLLNSLNSGRNAQQLLQQQLLQQIDLAGLSKLLGGNNPNSNNEKVSSKKNEEQTFNDQETPIDLSVKQSGLDGNALTQLYASYNLLNNLDDQSTFSPSSSNEENFGLTGGLPIDLTNPSTLAALVQLNSKNNLLNNLNNFNNNLAGLGSLNNNLNAINNLLNLNHLNSNMTNNNLNNNNNNSETKEDDTFDNSEDNLEDNEDDSTNKLQQTLNQLSAKNLLAQINPNLLNLNNNNDLSNLLNLANNSQLLANQLKQQQTNNKISQSLDILRKFDSNPNVQKQNLNKLTSQIPNSLSSLNSLASLNKQRKKIDLTNANKQQMTKVVANKELVCKDKNNNEDEELNEIVEDEQINDELNDSELINEENIKDEEINEECATVNEESSTDEQQVRSPEKEENDGEDEMSEDENSRKLTVDDDKCKRRKRSVSQSNEDFEMKQSDDEDLNKKKIKKDHHTDTE